MSLIKKSKNSNNGKNNGKEKKIKEENLKINKPKWHEDLREETKHSILAVIFFALSLIFTLTAFDKAGIFGNYIYKAFNFIFGAGYFLLPFLFFIFGVTFLISFRTRILAVNLIGGGLFLISALGIIESVFGMRSGGYFGYIVSSALINLFDLWVALIILLAFLTVSVLMIFNISLRLIKKNNEEETAEEPADVKIISPILESSDIKTDVAPEETPQNLNENKKPEISKKETDEKENSLLGIFSKKSMKADSGLPPTNLLQGDKGKPSFGDIKANSNIIKRTLQNFGIEVEMGEVSIGPSVTQFTLKPAQGIKLSRITGLSNDLSLALAAHPLRIEAPIPGKSLIGIEVPNKSASLVGLKSLIEAPEFQESRASLVLSLGRNVAGHAVYADLAKMPHLLIAGSTGSGKSVSIHAVICSLLYKNTAKNIRFLMVDPKRVELNVYSSTPHLLCPAITDAKKTILALRWTVKEMERRYGILNDKKVRDINSYRELMKKQGEEHNMPFLVVIIDELADIMAVYPRELEASIVRLAQMSRAVGIHLIVSTQRPSVEVITGLIKANITSRIAFQVASQIDSRTILDMSGAEKLLGNGDMLFLSGDSGKPRRIQGAFVSEEEVKRVASYLENEYLPELSPDGFDLIGSEESVLQNQESSLDFSEMEDEDDGDDLYQDARKVILEAGKASTSYLQRRLKVGYARAARLIDILEKRGVVGPADGVKPREVLVRKEEI